MYNHDASRDKRYIVADSTVIDALLLCQAGSVWISASRSSVLVTLFVYITQDLLVLTFLSAYCSQ